MIHSKHPQASFLPSPDQSGFTIIESLVAILMVTILLAAIAPVIVLSAATRLQAKRIEVAVDAAKKYIDGLRSGEITAPSAASSNISSVTPPPGGSLTCASNSYCTAPSASNYSLFCVNDVDSSGCTSSVLKGFVIQAFRYNPSSSSTSTVYQLGVRVYRPDAFADSTTLKTSSNTNGVKSSTYTGGLGDRKAPLLEMTTDISNTTEFTNSGSAFSDYCSRLKSTSTPSPTSQSQC